MVKFWDTSAIVPLTIDEPESGTLQSVLEQDGGVVVWWATRVEMSSALSRSERNNVISSDDAKKAKTLIERLSDTWAEVVPSDDVRERAVRLLFEHELRAADALQLAAALVWACDDPRGSDFVCVDRKLRTAASRVGFKVLPVDTHYSLAP